MTQPDSPAEKITIQRYEEVTRKWYTEITPDPHGDWCKWAEVSALAEENERLRKALPTNEEIEAYSAFANEIQNDEPEAASMIRVMCVKFRAAIGGAL
jgi:hypothetical protein